MLSAYHASLTVTLPGERKEPVGRKPACVLARSTYILSQALFDESTCITNERLDNISARRRR